SAHCLRLVAPPCKGTQLMVQRSSPAAEVIANSPARNENGGANTGSSPNNTISARVLLVICTSGFVSGATRCSQNDSVRSSPATAELLEFRVLKARKAP